jgi:hypothetical protein
VTATTEDAVPLLHQLATAGWIARCLHVAAELGVADALDDAPRTAAELARDVGADAGALGRLLRLLASVDVFAESGAGFAHSPASRLLRSDHPQSFRAYVRMMGLPMHWATYGFLEHAVRTGRPAVEKISPSGGFGYFVDHPDEARVFDAAMAAKAHAQIPEILARYDFSRFRSIADIGGGRGHLIRAVLEAAPRASGVLFDLPHVIRSVADLKSDRLTLKEGDFFAGSLPTCELYLLLNVLHDWADTQAGAILQSVRRAAPPQARVLVLESIVPPTPGPHHSKVMDIEMLAMTTGRERTAEEFKQLLAAAGWRPTQVLDTRGRTSIIEAASE